MDMQPTVSRQDLVAHIAANVAEAVSERPGESRQRRNGRVQAAAGAVLAFQPCDAVEAMIAGQCVMLHEVIVDTVHGLLCCEECSTRRPSRTSVAAMDKAFGNNLVRLNHYRSNTTEATEGTLPSDGCTETDIADRIRRHRSQTEPRNQSASAQAAPPAPWSEAAGVLDADDPPQCIREDQPSDGWPAAAQMDGLNRQTRRALDRQARKRPPAAASPGIKPTHNGPATITSATTAG